MMGKKKPQIMIMILFLCGLLVMTYPFYSNAVNSVWDSITMKRYIRQEKSRFHELKKQAAIDNETLINGHFSPGSDPFEEESDGTVTIGKEHLVGSVIIPILNLEVPFYDLTNPDLLEIGVTLLDGTSYPLDQETGHAVITGHRGLPNRELFTNIPKLEEGDLIIVDVLGEKNAYQVNHIEVVLPHETESLKIQEGINQLTLVTCTPYMINSHRLLVTGTQVEYTEEIQEVVNKTVNTFYLRHVAIVGILGLVVIVLLVRFILVLTKKKYE